MSLSSSMNISASGLQASSQTVAGASDNVANMRSESYKRVVTAVFSDTRTSMNDGGWFPGNGVTTETYRLISEVGAPRSTTSQTDLYINGAGFFPVSDTVDGTGLKSFTRVGDFTPDASNRLVNRQGKYLLGWATDSSGVPLSNKKDDLDELGVIDVSEAINSATPTSRVSLELNLPAQSKADSSSQFISTITVYDSLGTAHDLQLAWQKTDVSPQTWTVTVGVGSDGTVTASSGGAYTDIDIVFDGTGAPLTFDGGTSLPDIDVTWNNGANDSTIVLNLGTIGAKDGITALDGDQFEISKTQDGFPPGQFLRFSVGSDGIVTAYFDNQTHLKMFQIPIATVPNPNGLDMISENAFLPSSLSGEFFLNVAGSGSAGHLQAQKLEESTVDIASEFAIITLAQQNFSACTHTFRTANEMLSQLERLGHR